MGTTRGGQPLPPRRCTSSRLPLERNRRGSRAPSGRSGSRLPVPKPCFISFPRGNPQRKALGDEPMLTPGKVRELTFEDRSCDSSAFRARTGWTPQISLAQGFAASTHEASCGRATRPGIGQQAWAPNEAQPPSPRAAQAFATTGPYPSSASRRAATNHPGPKASTPPPAAPPRLGFVAPRGGATPSASLTATGLCWSPGPQVLESASGWIASAPGETPGRAS